VKTLAPDNPKLAELKEMIASHRDTRGALIEVLHKAQDLFGYLPPDLLRIVAQEMDLPLSTVYGVTSFYSYFRMTPQGEHVIHLCLGTACHVRGADRVAQILTEELGVGIGETTPDGRFTLTAVRCVGACGLAPVMMIDEDVYGKLDRKRIKQALARY
jgi:NADH:ubiquinone oxidoreductase subunit E